MELLIIALNVFVWIGISILVIGLVLGLVVFAFICWEIAELARWNLKR